MRSSLSVLVALAALFVGVAGLAPAAEASGQWCWADPAQRLVTPGGNSLVVYVTNYAPDRAYIRDLARDEVTYTARNVTLGDGRVGTVFEVSVLIPNDPALGGFRTSTVLSSKANASGTLYDSDSGNSGTPTRLLFMVQLP